MLTFEKVLEIFADYLTADETIEVYISRHGCVELNLTKIFTIALARCAILPRNCSTS